MQIAKNILSSISRTPCWPAKDLIQESWLPITPYEEVRMAPTFYFSASGLRSAALLIIEKHKSILAGLPFEQVVDVCIKFLKEELWPQDHVKILGANDVLLKVYGENEELRNVERRFGEFVKSKFEVKLYMTPIRCDGVIGHVTPPPTDLSKKTESWISTRRELDHFIVDRFVLNTNLNLTNFPPEEGFKKIEVTKTIGLSWFLVLATNEQIALTKIKMLLGAICIAVAPQSLPKTSDSRFGGIAHIGMSDHGFGAFFKFQIPTIFANAEITERRTDSHLEIYTHTNFELSVVDKLTLLGDTGPPARVRRAIYYLGVSIGSDEISTYVFFASALDALFNFDNRSLTKAAILGLPKFSDDCDAAEKIKILLAIRGRLSHGRRMTPQEASDYIKYWRCFDEEPLDGFWRLLRSSIVAILADISHYESELEKIESELSYS